ncbi:hypothetical protein HPE56_08605 [Maribacter sp. ANRC-HE7]|uniref:Carbohydrate kinase PfkB domain-containing protein n=1 Tax=Maribacter aquimaris TaxID=2737171 RepID=A0ABR7UZ20_9FLAO|nr:PfkB family carbohydrate kinase [Maribacter aquimaris]MBD0777852.1 hypothetical protein [Maribacter aquimaris]
MGVLNVVITLESKGALIFIGQRSAPLPYPLVTVKDTTAAGDCFKGYLAVALSKNKSMKEAVSLAYKRRHQIRLQEWERSHHFPFDRK